MSGGNKKFSQFVNGSEVQIGDQVVGLRAGVNNRFSFPGIGIKDGNGNFLFQYDTAGASATNYLKFVSATSASDVVITADGTDANVGINISPKGTGRITLSGLRWPNSDGFANYFLTTDGAGDLSFTNSAALVDYFPFIVGANGQYTSVQDAIDAASMAASSSTPQLVIINPGLYQEDISLPAFVGLSSFGGSRKNEVIIEGSAVATASSPQDFFNISGITFLTSASTNPAFSSQGTSAASFVIDGCYFNGTLGTSFENLNSSAFGIMRNCEFECSASQKNFNIIGGQFTCLNALTSSVDTESTVDSAGSQLNFQSGIIRESFVVTNGAQISMVSPIVITPITLNVATVDATSLFIALDPGILCNHPSGFWITGTGTIVLTSQASFAGSAQNIDPTLNIFSQPLFVGSLVLKGQFNALDLNNNFINNVLDPALQQDAATKNYVDTSISLFVYPFTEVVGTSQSMSVNNGYIANDVGLVTLTLPAVCAVGDTIVVQGKGTGLFRISQNAGQTIFFGTAATTPGVTGSMDSTQQYDSVRLVCITANNDWSVLGAPQGTYTIL